jgi:predicted transcriptional regulator
MTLKPFSQQVVTLKVASLSDAASAFGNAWATGQPSEPTIAFASWELMHRTLTPKRLALLQAMCGQEPMSIRELSRRVDRDFKGVHTDVMTLTNAGLVERQDNKIGFPYAGIHVEFDVGMAA